MSDKNRQKQKINIKFLINRRKLYSAIQLKKVDNIHIVQYIRLAKEVVI